MFYVCKSNLLQFLILNGKFLITMAWLQNLAGHAENLLNKIDQNAATVLNEGNKPIVIDEE